MISGTKDADLKEAQFFSSMSQVLEHLEKAIEGVKELDSSDVVKDIEMWKNRALLAEKKNKQMAEEIEKLKREKESFQFRFKKIAVSRGVDTVQNITSSTSANTLNESSFAQNYKSFQELRVDVTPENKELRKLIGHKRDSFRHKWNKASISNRIQGIEMEEEKSIGASTAAARKYLNGMLSENDKMFIPNEISILETREDERSL